jgi:NADH-quinone oxidoreductase subunit L
MVVVNLIAILIPLMPLLGFLIIALSGKRMVKEFASFIACSALFLSFAGAAFLFYKMIMLPAEQRAISVHLFNWISAGGFTASFSFLIDQLSIIFMLIITGVGYLIHVYSVGYMHDDAGFNRFMSYLNLFIFFMLLLVMGANYLVMFVGWEGVGLCSYLLIGFWFKKQEYNSAANKAFIMNRIGDLGMLLGVILIFVQFSSIQYQDVFAKAGAMGAGVSFTLITVLLFVGAMGKSAQIPLYTWLPDAMAGPTPVSALIHAATMVTAGIYMVARNNLLYALSPISMQLVEIVGISTALLAAIIATSQHDIKKILAYSTVSQLGLMFLAMGLGAFSSGVFHVMTHAFFKALLFLGAGSVIHALGGEQDIRNMGGLKKHLPLTFLTMFAGVLAISGIPPFAGFFSKDEILAAAFADNIFLWPIAVTTSLLTVFYMFRMLYVTFYGQERASAEAMSHIHESPNNMVVPLMILAVLSTVGGMICIPDSLGGHHMMAEFMAPVFAGSSAIIKHHHLNHTTDYEIMGVVFAMTVILILMARRYYVTKYRIPKDNLEIRGFKSLVLHKFYVDELYHAIIVKPLYAIAAFMNEIIEKLGIDRLINEMGNSVILGSRGARHLHQGRLGYYIFAMVLGIIGLISIAMWLKV